MGPKVLESPKRASRRMANNTTLVLETPKRASKKVAPTTTQVLDEPAEIPKETPKRATRQSAKTQILDTPKEAPKRATRRSAKTQVLETPPEQAEPEQNDEQEVKNENAKAIEELYKMKDPQQHVLDIPDTYIGSIAKDIDKMWIYDSVSGKIIYKEDTEYIPGLYKIYDEVLVNSNDHGFVDKTCNKIKINIDEENGEISCWNNGQNGIPVAMHQEYNLWVPEMIFGHLRSSGRYDQKGKITGGKNGFGAKLANIFSTHFYVEVVDGARKLKYTQNFYNNMSVRETPTITKIQAKLSDSYVLIKFKPDFQRFGITCFSDIPDTIGLFRKRAYDIAANVCCRKIQVYLDDELIELKTFHDYLKMYYEENPEETTKKIVYEEGDHINEETFSRWRVGVVFDPNAGYRQISYVNGIYTFQGGSHERHVVDQIINALIDHIKSKHKDLKIKPVQVRENLTFFINSIIEDPIFTSQIKETLKTQVKDFGSKFVVTQKFVKDLIKTGVIEEIVNMAKLKQMADLTKTDGKKNENLNSLVKLQDAHWAGTNKSRQCRLMLTEGDSAKTFAIYGMSVVGKDKYGAFPLRGKLLNVREATATQLVENEEIINIKKIMGLKNKLVYDNEKNLSTLRYGGIIVLTDQDYDGSHIKGLIMNFIHYFWPELLQIRGFIQTMATPILKVFKPSDTKKDFPIKTFYSISDYDIWKKENPGNHGIKYYKGLATSSPEEAKESFVDFDKKITTYFWDKDNYLDDHLKTNEDDKEENDDDYSKTKSSSSKNAHECHKAILLAFSKTQRDERKKWLTDKYDKDVFIDTNERNISFNDFVNKDLIHFSNYNVIRAIPSICDGFKPSVRKILYGCIEKNLYKNEIKVAQLAGYIAEKTAYHHGEVSMMETIIGLAQNFVGSNNLNLLMPRGAFGTRLMGGKDAGAARYIFTLLNDLVKNIFRKEDDKILDHVDDDGTKVEPYVYFPIIPMILVNGAVGIGTGFSTDIAPHHPLELIKNIKHLIRGEEMEKMMPYFKGFKGTIVQIDNQTFHTRGTYTVIDEDTVVITELPIGIWTENYKMLLNSMIWEKEKTVKQESEDEVSEDIKNKPKKKTQKQIEQEKEQLKRKKEIDKKIIKKYVDDSSVENIKFTITFIDGAKKKLIMEDKFEKVMQLVTSIKLTNMYLYDTNNKIKKYNTIFEIMNEFYTFRMSMYEKRKLHYIRVLENEINIIFWKIKFLEDYMNKVIIMHETKIVNGKEKTVTRSKDNIIQQIETLKYPKLCNNVDAPAEDRSYDYLKNLSLFSLTTEELEKLKKELEITRATLEEYKRTTTKDLWLKELDEFEVEYHKWLEVDKALAKKNALLEAKKIAKKK